MSLRNFAFIFIVLIFAVTGIKAQNSLSPLEMNRLLEKADKATKQYTETFKNLSAEETKTFKDYEKNGRLKETREVKSNFIVYQSSKGEVVNEFRYVTEFNGMPAASNDRDVEKLFVKLTNAPTNTDEGKMLKKEALRFDGKSSAWGMTLWQESPFGRLKPFFEYTLAGEDQIQGRKVLIIAYKQIKPTLLLKFNPTEKDWKTEPDGREYRASVSSAFRDFNARLAGKIWLDAETAQIWRNEFKVTIQPSPLTRPIVALDLAYEYQPSEYHILVPRKFDYTIYKISGSTDKDLSIIKDRTMSFEYSKFSQFKSETKDFKASDAKNQ